MPSLEFVVLASGADDIDNAAAEVLHEYQSVETDRVMDDSVQQSHVREFLNMCIAVLEREASIGHRLEAEVNSAMRDVARRGEDAVMDAHTRGFQRIGQIRAFHRSHAAIAQARRSLDAVCDMLPRLSVRPAHGGETVTAVADAAIEAAHTHADVGPAEHLISELGRSGARPDLLHLLRAHLSLASANPGGALEELDRALGALDSSTDRRLLPHILASRGVLWAWIDESHLDEGIALCRAGRRSGLRPWQRATAADASLARLLLWRAERSAAPLARRRSDIHRALRLMRRRCRPWHPHGVGDLLLLQEILGAQESISSTVDRERRQSAWSRLAEGPWSITSRAAVAAAWAEWTVGVGDTDCAAQAYQRLVALVAEDSATRYTAVAKQRVLAAAQEYAEEAGYWLTRSGRYREAVLTLETGRAVGLTEVLRRDGGPVAERLRALGRADLAASYERALGAYEELAAAASPRLHEAWEDFRAVARRVEAATGADPLTSSIGYADITAETGEGAIVYLAAAKAGGYALVVAAHHEPQFVDIPQLDHASVSALVGAVLPAAMESRGAAKVAGAAGRAGADADTSSLRDAVLAGRVTDSSPVTEGLRTLWTGGIAQLLWRSARGRIVTLVPIGLLSLLPLHAAGEPGTPGDPFTEGRHAGHLSAIRYAPNVRGLRRCRETARELAGHGDSLLALDVPDGFGLGSAARLQYVSHETDEVTRLWAGSAAPLHGCTWQEFSGSARDYSVWHFACHGSADPYAIMQTRLYFADRSVSLEELRRALPSGRRRLAVLSACDTNLTDAAVPNEVTGLPSALIQVGFAGVVAAAWKVDDLATAYLMSEFYRLWRHEGVEPPIALNRAQGWLRSSTRADLLGRIPGAEPRYRSGEFPYVEPRYWAAFAYTGA